VVAGRAGEAPPESGIGVSYRCPACGYAEYTYFTDPAGLMDWEAWDGSDFFTIWPLPMFVFITERVAQALEENGLTNYELTRIEELDVDPLSVAAGLAPGAREYWNERVRHCTAGE